MNGMVLGLSAAASGAVTFVTGTVAQAAGGIPEIAPVLTGGGGAVAVAALGYVVRAVLKGELLAKQTADLIGNLTALVKAAGDREARAMKVAEDAIKLAERWEKQQIATNRLLWRVDQLLGGTDDRREPRRDRSDDPS